MGRPTRAALEPAGGGRRRPGCAARLKEEAVRVSNRNCHPFIRRLRGPAWAKSIRRPGRPGGCIGLLGRAATGWAKRRRRGQDGPADCWATRCVDGPGRQRRHRPCDCIWAADGVAGRLGCASVAEPPSFFMFPFLKFSSSFNL
jgi:hypothetical protein